MKGDLQEYCLETLKMAREGISNALKTATLFDQSYGVFERRSILCGIGNEAIRERIWHYLRVEDSIREGISMDDLVRTVEPITRTERTLLKLAASRPKSFLELAIAHLRSEQQIQTEVAQCYSKQLRSLLEAPAQASGNSFLELRNKLPSSAYHYEHYQDGLDAFLKTYPQYASFDIAIYFNVFAHFSSGPAIKFAEFGYAPEFQLHSVGSCFFWGDYGEFYESTLADITAELIATVLACNMDLSTLDYPVYRTIKHGEVISEYQFQSALVAAAIVDCFEFNGEPVDLFSAAKLINEEYSKLIIDAYLEHIPDAILKSCLDHGYPSVYLEALIRELPELQLENLSSKLLDLIDLEFNTRMCADESKDYES